MSHRFARFFVPNSQLDIFKSKIDEYFEEIMELDPGTHAPTLKEDQEIIEEKEDELRHIKIESSGNGKSFTLMMVCDLNKNPSLTNETSRKQGLTERYQITSCVIGEMIVLRESEVSKDDYQRVMCKWMLLFLKKFNNLVMSLKFFELRPQNLA